VTARSRPASRRAQGADTSHFGANAPVAIAWAAVTGTRVPGSGSPGARKMQARVAMSGLTVTDVETLAALAAIGRGTLPGLLTWLGLGSGKTTSPVMVCESLLHKVTQGCRHGEADGPRRVRWLAVLGRADRRTLERAWLVLADDIPSWQRAGVPEDVMPWAWAAGMTPSEAEAILTEGRLQVAALRGVVVLRGILAPALPAFAASRPLDRGTDGMSEPGPVVPLP
jgi:hypothetical protein